MNGQNSDTAEAKKPKAWRWQEVVIAVLAMTSIFFSTVIVARGVDNASIAAHSARAGTGPTLHDSVMSAMSAAASEVGLDKIREEARSVGNGVFYRFNTSSFPPLGSLVASAERPFVAVFYPILHSGQ